MFWFPSFDSIVQFHRSIPSFDSIVRFHRSISLFDSIVRFHRSIPSFHFHLSVSIVRSPSFDFHQVSAALCDGPSDVHVGSATMDFEALLLVVHAKQSVLDERTPYWSKSCRCIKCVEFHLSIPIFRFPSIGLHLSIHIFLFPSFDLHLSIFVFRFPFSVGRSVRRTFWCSWWQCHFVHAKQSVLDEKDFVSIRILSIYNNYPRRSYLSTSGLKYSAPEQTGTCSFVVRQTRFLFSVPPFDFRVPGSIFQILMFLVCRNQRGCPTQIVWHFGDRPQ